MDNKNNNTPEINESEWPNTVTTRDELDNALEDGLNSGRSERTVHDIFEERIAKFKND